MNSKKIKKKILITAGPTIEPLDPVRFISNFSTGTMGYEIAHEAKRAGYRVSLITGPVGLFAGKGIKVFRVMTAMEMLRKVEEEIKKHDCIVMTAAVCDFRPAKKAKNKIKKKNKIVLKLIKNPDILTKIKKNKKIKKIGFALETSDFLKNAEKKLKEKGLDIIVANRKSTKNDPFGKGKKEFIILNKNGEKKVLKNATKTKCAAILIKAMGKIL